MTQQQALQVMWNLGRVAQKGGLIQLEDIGTVKEAYETLGFRFPSSEEMKEEVEETETKEVKE